MSIFFLHSLQSYRVGKWKHENNRKTTHDIKTDFIDELETKSVISGCCTRCFPEGRRKHRLGIS